MAGFKSYNAAKAQEKAQEKAQKALEKLTGASGGRRRHKLSEGTNLFWVLPLISDKGTTPWAHYNVHFNPIHLCNRAHPVENPQAQKDKDLYITDGNFSNCPRCLGAWEAAPKNAEGRLDRSDDEGFRAFKRNMPSHQIVLQAVNFTPFFNPPKGRNPNASPNKALIKEWMPAFVEILRASTLGEEYEIPEDMPEEIAEAAEAGVNILMVSEYSHRNLFNTYYEKYYEEGEEDPLMSPDATLLQIKKTEAGTFNGGKNKKYSYNHSFAKLKNWGFPKELDPSGGEVISELFENNALYDIFDLTAYDHQNIETLEDKAAALIQLADEELREMLADHNYGPPREQGPPEKGDDESDDFDAADPDTFQPSASILGGRGRKKLDSLRAELED